MKLNQKKLFVKKEFTLKEDSLHVIIRDLTSSEEVSILYEEIDTSKLIKHKKTDNLMLICTLIFAMFFIVNLLNPQNYKDNESPVGVLLFLFVTTLLCGLITAIKSKNVLLIPTAHNRYIEVYNTKKNKAQEEAFIAELSVRIHLFLKSKYGQVDVDLPAEPQLMSFSWLKDRGVITSEEFDELKKELLQKK